MLLSLVFIFSVALVHQQCSAQLYPAAVPLFNKSPYLNGWLDTRSSNALPNQWPVLWSGAHILGFTAFIRVDGLTYELMGQEGNATTIAEPFLLTPTQSTFKIQAGPMLVTLSFLSPIEAADLALQSFPFSYISVNAQPSDGKSHAVQFYTDISAEWTSGDSASLVTWNTTQTGAGVIYHRCQRTAYQSMQEIGDLAEDATVYLATQANFGAIPTRFQTGGHATLRNFFATNGTLTNQQDVAFRAINNDFPVFAFSWDLSDAMATPIVWSLGLVRDPAVIYTTSSGNQTRSSHFFSKYGTVENALESFVADFSGAQSRATALDSKLTTAASAISTKYADLVTLSARIVMSGSEITVSKFTDGKYNSSDVMMFMKDVGNSRRVNPVDVLYASLPAFLYLNATWGAYLLEPLLRYQHDLPTGKAFALPDLGSAFPSATGNTAPSIFRGLEDSSSMIIMAWAHAYFTGDATILSRYYPLFKTWSDFLVQNTLTPSGFLTYDGQDSSNMTNLAIKGILAVRSMAEISKSVGQDSDSSSYMASATSFAKSWKTLGGSNGHLQSTYDSTSSWALMYNLFPDKLLGFSLVDASVYTAQNAWYISEAESASPFGLPFDSNEASVAKSQWTMLTAATVDTATRDVLINMVHSKAATNTTTGVFPTQYDTGSGASSSGTASPAHGAVFGLLSLTLQGKPVSGSITSKPSSSSSSKKAGIIAGSVVGSLAVLTLAVFFVFFYKRGHKRKRQFRIYLDTWEPKPLERAQSQFASVPPEAAPPMNPYPMSIGDISRSASSAGLPSSNNSAAGLLRGPSSSTREEAPPLPRKGVVLTMRNASPPSHGRSQSQATTAFSDAISPDSEVLRTEVENLRREMDEIRARSNYEPPPQYH